jgi:hypothetical protein
MPRAVLTAPLAAGVTERLGEVLAGLALLAESARAAGVVAGAVLLAVGLVGLTVALRAARPLAAAGGAVVGALAGLAARGTLALHFGLSPALSAASGAALLAVACGAFPPLFPFAVGALPGALLGAHAPIAGRGAFGAAAGGLVAGVVTLLFSRPVAAGFAALASGLLAGAGLLAIAGDHPLAVEIARHPLALIAFAIVIGIAGAAFQLSRADAAPGHGERTLADRDG